jgi:hypothetical protein
MATLANPDLSPAKPAFEAAMVDLEDRIRANAAERDKNATGATVGSMTHTVTAYPGALFARLEANENWKWMGNGRGPGRMPPVQNIQRWVEARGLTISAWAVAKRIAKEGSKDYRMKNANIFEQSIVEWQGGKSLDDAMGAVGDVIGTIFVNELTTGLR